MKTCSIKGNVQEYKTDLDIQLFVRDLIIKAIIKANEGIVVMNHYRLGHKMVLVDGLSFLEFAELED